MYCHYYSVNEYDLPWVVNIIDWLIWTAADGRQLLFVHVGYAD